MAKQLFLSFLLLFCMVAPKKKLVNISFSTSSNSLNIYLTLLLTQPMNIKIKIPRSQSNSSSLNSSRKSLIYSNMSSIAYIDRVQALANNLS